MRLLRLMQFDCNFSISIINRLLYCIIHKEVRSLPRDIEQSTK